MRRALIALTLAACSAPAPPPAVPDDPEAVATAAFTHAFGPPELLAPHFGGALQPEAFPPRLATDAASYRFVDLWRTRSIDGRIVVEALLTLDGSPHVQLVWLERQRAGWQIVGWAPRPTPVASEGPAPSAGITVPRAFAAPTLRGTEATPILPVDAPRAQPAGQATMRARVHIAEREGRCGQPKALTRAIAAVGTPISQCVSGADGRGGRLTFKVTIDGSAGRVQAEMLESTLLIDGLRDCAEAAFAALPVPLGPGRTCVAETRVTLRKPR